MPVLKKAVTLSNVSPNFSTRHWFHDAFTAVFQRIHVSLVLREQANGGVTTLKNRTRKSSISAHAFRVQVGAVAEKELNGAVVEVIAISNTHIWCLFFCCNSHDCNVARLE
jgi:hypothetical protein